jgi:hypothetical protein
LVASSGSIEYGGDVMGSTELLSGLFGTGSSGSGGGGESGGGGLLGGLLGLLGGIL